MTETEKEMQTIREAATEKDLRKLDSLTHHLRSSWEILRADQPLRELYRLLHSDVIPDEEVLSHAVIAVLNKGAEIIRLAEEERRKYKNNCGGRQHRVLRVCLQHAVTGGLPYREGLPPVNSEETSATGDG